MTRNSTNISKRIIIFLIGLMFSLPITVDPVRTWGFEAADLDDINRKSAFFSDEAQCGIDSACECTAGSVQLSGSDNAERIWKFFIGKGLQPHQAAGIMGNMMAESGLNPKRVQSTPTPAGDKDDITVNGTTGYGLVQWTDRGRQQGLADNASAANVISGDLNVQLEYVMEELGRPPYLSSSYQPLLASTTVEEATNIILVNYETPKDINGERPKRQNFARNFLTLYGSGTGITTTPSGQGNGCATAIGPDGCPTGPVNQNETVSAEGIRVHGCVAEEVARILVLAKSKDIKLSGWGWRDNKRQIELRDENGCGGSRLFDASCKGRPPTAVPGSSRHERGTAIDFTCSGTTIKSRSSPCFTFLRDNTSLKNLPSEAWHWSIDGS